VVISTLQWHLIFHGVTPYNPTTGEGSVGVEFVGDNVVNGGLFGGHADLYVYE
jgi:hypothetical protein